MRQASPGQRRAAALNGSRLMEWRRSPVECRSPSVSGVERSRFLDSTDPSRFSVADWNRHESVQRAAADERVLTNDHAIRIDPKGDGGEGRCCIASRVLEAEVQGDRMECVSGLREPVPLGRGFARFAVGADELPAGIDVPDCGEVYAAGLNGRIKGRVV